MTNETTLPFFFFNQCTCWFESVYHDEECLQGRTQRTKPLRASESVPPLAPQKSTAQKTWQYTHRHVSDQIIECFIPKDLNHLIRLQCVHSSSSFEVEFKTKTNNYQFGSSSLWNKSLSKFMPLVCKSTESTKCICLCIFI